MATMKLDKARELGVRAPSALGFFNKRLKKSKFSSRLSWEVYVIIVETAKQSLGAGSTKLPQRGFA